MILLLTRRIGDAPAETRPKLDIVGAVLSAAGLALIVLGVLRSSEWGWINPKPDPAKAYKPLVSSIDADGNELGGLRLPDIVVPLATHTGWNLYKRPFTEGELCDRDGTYAEFASTKAEREAKKDPRPSLAERYGTHANFVGKVKEAAERLLAERLLLPDDAAAYVKWAESAGVGKRFTP